MGSPVSAVVANLYMEFFKELALRIAPARPRIWKRYVDDMFTLVKKGDVDELLVHLNSIRPSIKLTTELEEGGSIPFLDTRVTRKVDGKLDVTVYRKPTHTDRYLHFSSHHPTHVKKGLVRCLYDRARNITKEASNLEAEKAHLSGALKRNGYPGAFVRAASQKSKPRERDPEEAQGEGKPTLMMLPYVAGVSERIRKACRNYNIRVVFRSGPTFRSMLTKVKDPLPIEKQANVVYEIPCTCGKVYIGETKRHLGTRLNLRSTRMPALEATPTSQRSPNMLGQRTTPSTGVALRFCSTLATPWSWWWRKAFAYSLRRRTHVSTGTVGMSYPVCKLTTGSPYVYMEYESLYCIYGSTSRARRMIDK